jgi:hypothetical protein
MRRPLLFIDILFYLLLLASPVFAISYSTSAFLNITTLSFSGVSISPLGSGGFSQTVSTFLGGTTTGGSKSSWVSEKVNQHDSQVGEAGAIGDSKFMGTSANLIGSSGSLSSFVSRDATFSINGTGNLTVSIQYALAQSGLLEPAHVGGSFVTMDFVFLSNGIADQLQTQGSFPGDGSKSGTLRLTQWFDAGQEATLNLRTTSFVAQVPVPDMLWPTLAVIVGLAMFTEKRRRVLGSANRKH